MLHEIDESLRTLIQREALGGADVEVSFEAPTKDWAVRRSAPTVDVYLYDIREDLDRRRVAYEDIRDAEGRVTHRRPPPRRFKLWYLVTAWTQRPEDEHRLLSALLSCFLRFDALPQDVLAGSLAQQPRPLIVSIALPPAEDRSPADVWTALGGELKPALDLVLIAPFESGRSREPGPIVLEETRLEVRRPGAPSETMAGKRPRRRRMAAERPPTAHVETVQAGTDAQPGRVVRVQGVGEP